MRKAQFGLVFLAILVILIFIGTKAFPASVWQLMHGSTYETGRIEMKLQPRWMVRQDDKGRDEIQRPEPFSSFPISLDWISIHQSLSCPDTEIQMEESYNKLLTVLSIQRRRPVRPIIHLVTSPEPVECAELTGEGGLMDCFFPKDGSYARIEIGSKNQTAREEALAIVKSIRIAKPCVHTPSVHLDK